MFGGAPEWDPFDDNVSSAEVAECLRWCGMGHEEAIEAVVSEHVPNALERTRRLRSQAAPDALGVCSSAAELPGIAVNPAFKCDSTGALLTPLPSKPFHVKVRLRHDIASSLEHEKRSCSRPADDRWPLSQSHWVQLCSFARGDCLA